MNYGIIKRCYHNLFKPPQKSKYLHKKLTKYFETLKVIEPESSSSYLIASVVGKETIQSVNPNLCLSASQLTSLEGKVKSRIEGIPIQYIIGNVPFHNISLKITPPVFIPRSETEELVQYILDFHSSVNTLQFLEIGTGSGAIGLSLLKEQCNWKCIAIEKTLHAYNLSMENLHRNGIQPERYTLLYHSFNKAECFQKALGDDIDCKVDFIVSNPPYIISKDFYELPMQVYKYEDHTALHGGVDGLDIIMKILEASKSLLKPQGYLWLEVDDSHPPIIQNLVDNDESFQLKYEKTILDFRNRPRFCLLRNISTETY